MNLPTGEGGGGRGKGEERKKLSVHPCDEQTVQSHDFEESEVTEKFFPLHWETKHVVILLKEFKISVQQNFRWISDLGLAVYFDPNPRT